MEITLRSIRSNLDLNPFPGIARRVDSAIRKDFQVYSFQWGVKMRTKFARQSGVPRIKLSRCRIFEAGMRFAVEGWPTKAEKSDSH